MDIDTAAVIAFRYVRSGLAGGEGVVPASDFSRDAGLLALAARDPGVTRTRFEAAVDDGGLVMGHSLRGAIHVQAPDDRWVLGRALIAGDADELRRQLGDPRVEAHHPDPVAALAAVADAVRAALAGGRRLDRVELHAALREALPDDLLPWCEGCGSHHVAPMLWRYATVAAGARLDSRRRYRDGGPAPAVAAEDAVRTFLRVYAPATARDFADWSGVAPAHARRLWAAVDDELTRVGPGRAAPAVLSVDEQALAGAPSLDGTVFVPPGDPFLWRINRPLVVPDRARRSHYFRAVSSPGAVLSGGVPVASWRVRRAGDGVAFAVEKTGRVAKAALVDGAERVAAALESPVTGVDVT